MDIDIIKQKAVPVLKRYGIARAAVFGSHAKEKQHKVCQGDGSADT